MNDLIAIEKIAQWEKLKALVLDSVSSPITKRVSNIGWRLSCDSPPCAVGALSKPRNFAVAVAVLCSRRRPLLATWPTSRRCRRRP